MSAPVNPTREKRNEILALSAAIRMSLAVERRHDRAATLPDGENEIAGEAGEREEPGGIPREQGADDVLDISAAAEGPAGACDDDCADTGLGVEGAEGVPELGVDLEGEGIEPLGPAKRDGRDCACRVDDVEERFRIQGHQCPHSARLRSHHPSRGRPHCPFNSTSST
jgi:hypothetical protein